LGEIIVSLCAVIAVIPMAQLEVLNCLAEALLAFFLVFAVQMHSRKSQVMVRQ
jgi:Ca2+/Na+ antiporter